MSTHWTYACSGSDVHHDIEADHSINHGNKDLMELLEAWGRGLVPREMYIEGTEFEISVELWGASWPWHFLRQHPNCHIKVVSEYGDTCWRDPATSKLMITNRDGKVVN